VAAALPDARIVVLEGQEHVADVLVPEVFAEHLLGSWATSAEGGQDRHLDIAASNSPSEHDELPARLDASPRTSPLVPFSTPHRAVLGEITGSGEL
jgi:hypothetical protein